MPLDYQSILDQKQQGLNDLLSNQGTVIPNQTALTRARILAGRKPMFDNLSSVASGISPSALSGINPALSYQTPALDRATNKALRQNQYSSQSDLLGKNVQNVTDVAQRGFQNVQGANAYSRANASQIASQDQTKALDTQSHLNQLALGDIADKYAQKGLALQDQYTYKPDASSAMLRLLFGTGAMLGTAYMMNQKPGGQLQSPVTNQYTNSLRGQSAFSSTIDPTTGQRITPYGGSY